MSVQGGYLRSDKTEEPERESTRNTVTLSFKRNLTKDLSLNINETYAANKGTGIWKSLGRAG